jgi:hypothetical protein
MLGEGQPLASKMMDRQAWHTSGAGIERKNRNSQRRHRGRLDVIRAFRLGDRTGRKTQDKKDCCARHSGEYWMFSD